MELTQTIKQAYTQVETYRTQKHRESPSLLFQEYLYTGDREEVCYFIAQAYEKREEKRLVTGRPVVVPYPLGKLEIIRTQKETQGNTLILPSQGDSQSPNTALPEKTDQRNLTHQRQAKKKPLSLFDEYRHRPRPHRTPCILRAYKKPEKPLAIQRVDHVKSTPMGKEEVGRDSPQLPETPPYKRLHQAIEQAGAYQFLNPLQHRLLQTYLTTEQTFTDIQ